MASINLADVSIDDIKAYEKETEQYFKDNLKEYLDDETKYGKSSTRFVLAKLYYDFAQQDGVDIPLKKTELLIDAAMDLKNDILGNIREIPYVSDTKELIDTLKLTEIGVKHNIISVEALKEDMRKWNGITCENVNFKEVENAIENKAILATIKPENSIFKKCNLQGLEQISISLKNNKFKNCTLDNERTVSKKKGSKAKTSLKCREPKKVDKELSRGGRS